MVLLHLLFSLSWNFFLECFFLKNHSLTPASSPDKRHIPIVTFSPAWAKSTCFFPVGHGPWPFYQLCCWISGCPGLSLALLNQGAQNKTDYMSYALGVSGTAGVTKCSPTWARVSCLSPELWKGECFMSLIYSGSLGMCPKIAICFFCTKHPVTHSWLIYIPSLPGLFVIAF